MTPEAQRIAISEACPFVMKQGSYELIKVSGRLVYFDPLNDLNAMREAEKVLTHDQQVKYSMMVGKLTTAYLPSGRAAWMDFSLINATATQRAEAFLKTLNLWTP